MEKEVSPADDERAVTSIGLLDYPSTRPFLNSEFVPKQKAVNSYPTSDRDAVISALRSLQEKMKRLEVERNEADTNLQSITTQTSFIKDKNKEDKETITAPPSYKKSGSTSGWNINNHNQELEGQLSSAESRCKLLENQLQHMQRLVDSSERSKQQIMEMKLRSRRDTERPVSGMNNSRPDRLGTNNSRPDRLGTNNSSRSERLATNSIRSDRLDKVDGDWTRSSPSSDLKEQLNRLNELERDQHRLAATQTLAEKKLKYLEEKLKEEKEYRKTITEQKSNNKIVEFEDRLCFENLDKIHNGGMPAKLIRNKEFDLRLKKHSQPTQSATKSHFRPTSASLSRSLGKTRTNQQHTRPLSAQPRLSADVCGPKPDRGTLKLRKPAKRKKKKFSGSGKKLSASTDQPRHYRLNLADIPFVAGKSTSASHSLGANVQRVLSMMKTHNMALCQHSPRANGVNHSEESSCSSPSSMTGDSSDLDLSDLLLQLQDEFGQLSCEHQDLMHKLQFTSDDPSREEIEEALHLILSRMETKQKQIVKVRQHLEKIDAPKQSKTGLKSAREQRRPNSAGTTRKNEKSSLHNHKISIPTTKSSIYNTNKSSIHNNRSSIPATKSLVYNTKNSSLARNTNNHNVNNGASSQVKVQSSGISGSKLTISNPVPERPALYMLRDMKKLQSTLRKDDIFWD